ncbi:MAG TPA: hypothetical protein VFA10_17855 [Ktedonobacteraceae bacterium]|nr:hypothetical protein [Ktedonobacteraceae bacterium]
MYASSQYFYFPPSSPSPSSQQADASKTEPLLEVPGWKDYDYQDYRDIEQAIQAGISLTYAQCQWLMRWTENETVLAAAFPGGKWETWYTYAWQHCERFAKEQPEWVKYGK